MAINNVIRDIDDCAWLCNAHKKINIDFVFLRKLDIK